MQILKPSRFRSPTLKDTKTEIYSSSIPHTEITSISTTQKNAQVNLDAHTKTKRFAARIQKPSQFRPPPPTQELSQSIITLKKS